MPRSVSLFFLACALLLDPTLCRVLNDFIRHFEPVDYDHEELMWNHHRLKRSVIGPKTVELNFEALGRDFNIHLKPERKIFDPNFTFIKNGRRQSKHNVFTYIYSGHELSDPHSLAYGNLAHGVFDGTVETSDGVYHVEPAMRYQAHLNENDTFHSIIYRHTDLDTSSITGAACGSTDSGIHHSMLRLQKMGSLQHTVAKRQADSTRTRCPLSVFLDNKLYAELTRNGESPMSVILSIILQGSSIFSRTDFDGNGAVDGINFSIKELVIEDTPPTGFFANNFIGVSAFLNEHSQQNYTAFCLAYRFTYRDFENGVVGLAYIAPQPGQNLRGGICDQESGGRTLNTGIVTSLNFGRRIPPSLSALTFAHEAGHNFGSMHDTGDAPPGGAYIMHAFATDGSQENNRDFSPASRSMMGPVIRSRGQVPGGCFVDEGDNCGNRLLDEGEECDCGSANNHLDNGVCQDNPCCFGRNCTLNGNVQCSPDQGPCCNSSCMYVPQSANQKCSSENDCAFGQVCGGASADCPEPMSKDVPDPPGFLLCEMGQGICNGPSCNGTLCTILNFTSCECPQMNQACHVCCMLDGVCTSTIDIAERNLNNLASRLPNGTGANRTVGTPCANFTGYCDLLNNCMAVDEDGALFRLANLFFNSETVTRFLDFATERWWVLVVGAIVIIVVMFLIVMLFHCILPRPKTVRSRNRRKTLHRLSQGHIQPYQTNIPPGDYPQNFPQYNQHY